MSQPTGGAPVKKGLNPLVIVLIVVASLFMMVGVAVVGGLWFLKNKAEEAGLSAELWEDNPGVAVTKMLAAINPDIEIVEIDEDRKLVTIRNKADGKTLTVDFDRLKEGNLVFEGEGGEQVEFSAEGGGLAVQTEQGGYQLGGASTAELPDWLEECPGCELKGLMSNRTNAGSGGMVSFTSPEPAESVIDFYDQALKDAGMEVNTIRTAGAAGGGGMVSGEDRSQGRKVAVAVGDNNGQTAGSITYSEQ